MYKLLFVLAIFVDDDEATTCLMSFRKCLNRNLFILIAVIGCTDITPPVGAWAQRDGDVTVVGCQSSEHTWTLRCENSDWVGSLGMCGAGKK